MKFKNRKYVHWNHFKQRFVLVMALAVFSHVIGFTQFNANASTALINRVIPGRATGFIVEHLQTNEKLDVFEIESRNDKIILRGNNGVAVASALYYYLTHFCHCQITWNGTNLNIPKVLPRVDKKSASDLTIPLSLLSELLHVQLQHELVGLEAMGKGNRLDGTAWHEYAVGYYRRRIYMVYSL